MRSILILLLLSGITACGIPTATPSPIPTSTRFPRPVTSPTAELPPTLTLTPFIYPPTVTEPPSACDNSPRPTRLVIQTRGVVIDDPENPNDDDEKVNVRSGPGTDNRVIAQIDIGETFMVIGGPRCTGSYAWFQVNFQDREGWIAEGDANAYYVAPFLPD